MRRNRPTRRPPRKHRSCLTVPNLEEEEGEATLQLTGSPFLGRTGLCRRPVRPRPSPSRFKTKRHRVPTLPQAYGLNLVGEAEVQGMAVVRQGSHGTPAKTRGRGTPALKERAARVAVESNDYPKDFGPPIQSGRPSPGVCRGVTICDLRPLGLGGGIFGLSP